MTVHRTFPKSPLSDLEDPRLVRNFSYVDGKWSGADDGRGLCRHQPRRRSSGWARSRSLSGEESRAAVDAAHDGLRQLVATACRRSARASCAAGTS